MVPPKFIICFSIFSAGVSIVSVAAGIFHTCALASGGGLWCWGYIGEGQLGGGNSAQEDSPVAVSLGKGGATASVSLNS